MTPILTIKLQKIQPKPKDDKANREKTGKMRSQPNPNEFIPSEVTLDDDHPEKKGEQGAKHRAPEWPRVHLLGENCERRVTTDTKPSAPTFLETEGRTHGGFKL